MTRRLWIALFSPVVALAQGIKDRMPDGRSRKLAILRDDVDKSREDVKEILDLAAELDEELVKNREYSVSLESLRKAERIEKLAKNIKNRLKRVQ